MKKCEMCEIDFSDFVKRDRGSDDKGMYCRKIFFSNLHSELFTIRIYLFIFFGGPVEGIFKMKNSTEIELKILSRRKKTDDFLRKRIMKKSKVSKNYDFSKWKNSWLFEGKEMDITSWKINNFLRNKIIIFRIEKVVNFFEGKNN